MTAAPGKTNGTGSGKKAVRSAIDAATPAKASPPAANGSSTISGAPTYLGKRFEMKKDGLYKRGESDDGAMWLSGPFEIEAETRDAEGRAWGLLMSWTDRDQMTHRESFPRALFAGECGEIRARLADAGLSLNNHPAARQAFGQFLNLTGSPNRARSVPRVGWHQVAEVRVFVLPDVVYGQTPEKVVLQAQESGPSVFRAGGTLQAWRETVSRFCLGNSRLTLAASCGFAAPMLDLLGEEGGGFHYRGSSRTGKSTALRVAASVCGGTPANGAGGFIRTWRATGNGLEGVAVGHCDSLLALDEIGQVDAREAGEIAYLLANGLSKIRGLRFGGGARSALPFKVLFLSTGEVTLGDKNAEAGKSTRAGQEVRLVDIPADAGAGLGIFEDLHNAAGGDEFSREIREATTVNFGTALPAFLEMLVTALERDGEAFIVSLGERVAGLVRRWLLTVHGDGGQVISVARRFALVAIAGELASETLITEWAAGWASTAAEACFRAWLNERGTAGAREDAQAVAQLRAFITRHSSARFEVWHEPQPNPAAQVESESDLPPPERFRVQQRAGWKRWAGRESGRRAQWIFLLTSEGLHEALSGLGFRDAVKTLVELGHVVPSRGASDARTNVIAGLHQVPGHGKVRLYEIADGLLAGIEGEI
jgi:uncharacterized protein (DUF927 family)